MPACNVAPVAVAFDYVVDIPLYAWLWATGYGYLEIVGFNSANGTLSLVNLCASFGDCAGDSQVAPGTPIPACTPFMLMPPRCSSSSAGSSLYPYLNSGFTAPANGSCILVVVTTTNGLSVGKTVQISTGTYRVSAISSSTEITICNDGLGLPVGTVVNYKDGAGNLIVPITLIDSNPCLASAVHSGKVLACSSGQTQPLVGTNNGDILVWDNGTGLASFRTLGIPTLDCTALTQSLTLDPALPHGTAYLINVGATGSYVGGQTILMLGVQFVISTILNSTQMRVVPVVDPVVIQTYAIGTSVCSADCCTTLSNRLDTDEANIAGNISAIAALSSRVYSNHGTNPANKWLDGQGGFADATAFTPAILNGANPLRQGNIVGLNVQNFSDILMMKVMFDVTYTWLYDLTGTDGQGQEVILKPYFSANIGGALPVGLLYSLPVTHVFQTLAGGGGVNRNSYCQHFSGVVMLPALQTYVLNARADIAWSNGAMASAQVQGLGIRMSAMGIAVV